jgi:tRNA nucleotidyltransferase (CCA-adding enzyme)
MLRAIRFSNQLGFEIEAKSFQSIAKMQNVSKLFLERVVDELNKILSTNLLKDFLLLYKTGLLDIILPELTALNQVEERGQTHKTIFYHTRGGR